MLNLAQIINKKIKSPSRIVYRDLPQDDPRVRCPDISLAQKTLGWKPKVSLDDGLNATISYFKKILTVKYAS